MAARTCRPMRYFTIRWSAVSVIRFRYGTVRFGMVWYGWEASWALRQRRSARPDWRRWPATLSVGRPRILISRRPPTAPAMPRRQRRHVPASRNTGATIKCLPALGHNHPPSMLPARDSSNQPRQPLYSGIYPETQQNSLSSQLAAHQIVLISITAEGGQHQ